MKWRCRRKDAAEKNPGPFGVNTGLADINNDSSRLTFPIVIGARFRF